MESLNYNLNPSNPSFARWRESCSNLLNKQQKQTSNRHSLFTSSSRESPKRHSRFPIHSTTESEPNQDAWKPDEVESKQDRKRREMCQQWRDELVRTSPMIRFMTKQLALVSCDPLTPSPSSSRSNSAPPKLHIATCPPNIAGGFGPSDPGRPTSESGILICSNRVINKSHMEDTLAHEMIHWWDHCRFKVDWNDLKHHACSEIRAASLSGDCTIGREFQRRIYGFSKQHQVCARRRAVLSVIDNPACPDKAAAERAVDEVWNSCFNDTRPFDEIY